MKDLEVLSYLCGTPPGPLFDTQVAAAFCGHGFQIGYQGLVQEVLGVELDKGETRSAWLKRPLTSSQVKYAAMDVACLIPIYAPAGQAAQGRGPRGLGGRGDGHPAARRCARKFRLPNTTRPSAMHGSTRSATWPCCKRFSSGARRWPPPATCRAIFSCRTRSCAALPTASRAVCARCPCSPT